MAKWLQNIVFDFADNVVLLGSSAGGLQLALIKGRKEEEIDRWIGATAAVMRTLHQVIVIKGRNECKKAKPYPSLAYYHKI